VYVALPSSRAGMRIRIPVAKTPAKPVRRRSPKSPTHSGTLRPEQVGMLISAGGDEVARCRQHCGRQEVVAREAVRIYCDARHERQVDHQPAFAHREEFHPMGTAAHERGSEWRRPKSMACLISADLIRAAQRSIGLESGADLERSPHGRVRCGPRTCSTTRIRLPRSHASFALARPELTSERPHPEALSPYSSPASSRRGRWRRSRLDGSTRRTARRRRTTGRERNPPVRYSRR